MSTYVEGWRLVSNPVAIYRDASKRSAPLTRAKTKKTWGTADDVDLSTEKIQESYSRVGRRAGHAAKSCRPTDAPSHVGNADVIDPTSSRIAGHEGYITVGLYEDGQPGELFIHMAKEGSTIGGLMDTNWHADFGWHCQYGATARKPG